ncbi:hypothetical protein GCM10007966_05390 [Legionella impletisoli]|uniref:Uncharacterized protein n=1 Tax=Legionella impletisoli TaxID=343510 RepID=A0A917JSS9_9GAMM|nr:hypothetical protein [Legionella impletisoli]GGI79777.1 hypothetical protein GCM10007966_05390 [Legionella impletisoli]
MLYKQAKSRSTRQNQIKSAGLAELIRAFLFDFNEVIVDLARFIKHKNSELGFHIIIPEEISLRASRRGHYA